MSCLKHKFSYEVFFYSGFATKKKKNQVQKEDKDWGCCRRDRRESAIKKEKKARDKGTPYQRITKIQIITRLIYGTPRSNNVIIMTQFYEYW